MACSIEILTVTATRVPPQTKANTVTVGGTAQECGQVNVTISCAQSDTKVANVGANGSWAVTFNTAALGCTCSGDVGVTAACVDDPNCFDESSFQLNCTACPSVDKTLNVIIQLDPFPSPLCFDNPTSATVTLTAMGTPGTGNYLWDFNDGTSDTTSIPTVSHKFEFPGTYNIKLTYKPAQPGCPSTTAYGQLYVPRCSELTPPPPPEGIIDRTDVDHTPKPGSQIITGPEGRRPETDVKPKGKGDPDDGDGGGKLACDALLVAAVLLFLAGGLAIAIGVCSKVPWVAIGGGVAAALAVALFFIWVAICGKISSCDVMQKMHRLLRLIVLFGFPMALIGGGLQAAGAFKLDVLCWTAIAGYYGSIAWLKDRLEDVMQDAGCPRAGMF